VKTYEAIVKGENIPEPGVPESFKVLIKELQSLSMNVRILNENQDEIEMRDTEDDAHEAVRELNLGIDADARSLRKVGDDVPVEDEDLDVVVPARRKPSAEQAKPAIDPSKLLEALKKSRVLDEEEEEDEDELEDLSVADDEDEVVEDTKSPEDPLRSLLAKKLAKLALAGDEEDEDDEDADAEDYEAPGDAVVSEPEPGKEEQESSRGKAKSKKRRAKDDAMPKVRQIRSLKDADEE
jgi:hypothetical protein